MFKLYTVGKGGYDFFNCFFFTVIECKHHYFSYIATSRYVAVLSGFLFPLISKAEFELDGAFYTFIICYFVV